MIRLLGGFLMVAGLAGFVLTLAAPRLPVSIVEPLAEVIDTVAAPSAALTGAGSTSRPPRAVAAAPARSPITRLVIPSIDLDTAVVPAPLAEHDGASTWDVPKFVAGHAEGSAGAGETGNAIVIGHVTSMSLGSVFEHVDRVRASDRVVVFSANRSFEYRVSDARDVSRTDVSVLDPTPTPSLTLITCSGLWLPTIGDYTQRRVVRAELLR